MCLIGFNLKNRMLLHIQSTASICHLLEDYYKNHGEQQQRKVQEYLENFKICENLSISYSILAQTFFFLWWVIVWLGVGCFIVWGKELSFNFLVGVYEYFVCVLKENFIHKKKSPFLQYIYKYTNINKFIFIVIEIIIIT